MLTGIYTPGLLPPDGTTYTDATMRAIASGTLTLSGLLENSQVTDDTLAAAKVTPAARRFFGLGYYNVQDPQYGATGDGSTDDRAAIQLAIDACIAAGGGVVWFPKGEYHLGSTTTSAASTTFICLDVYNAGSAIPIAFMGAPGSKITYGFAKTVGHKIWCVNGNFSAVVFDGLTTESTVKDFSNGEESVLIFVDRNDDHQITDFLVSRMRMTDPGFYWIYAAELRINRMCIINNSFLSTNGRPSGYQGIRCWQTTEELLVLGNFFDGCTSGSVLATGDPLHDAGSDGLVFGRANQRAVIASNIIRRFGYEAIYINSWDSSGLEALPGVDTANFTVTGNSIDGSAPLGGPSGYMGIRMDVASTVTGNNIRKCRYGVYIGKADPSHTNPDRCVIHGNTILVEGDFAALTSSQAAGVALAAGARHLVTGNSITFEENDGATSNAAHGVYLSGTAQNYNRISSNRISLITRTAGVAPVYGISFANTTSGTRITDNLLENLTGAFNWVNDSDAVLDNNEVLSCAAVTVGNGPYLSVFGRQQIIFTPTATGWHRISVGSSFVGLGGQLRISCGRAYGNFTNNQTSVVEIYGDATPGASLRQIMHRVFGSVIVSQVRIVDTMYVDIYVATVTNAAPIVLHMESNTFGTYLQNPLDISGAVGATATTTHALLELVSGASEAFANTSAGGWATYYTDGTPSAGLARRAGDVAVDRTSGGFYVATGASTWAAK